MKVSLAVLIAFIASIHQASAHSWLDCVDLRGNTCYGYARNFAKQPAVPMGTDVGRDQRPGADVPQGLVCGPRERPNANVQDGYSAQYPMAQIKPGSTVTMRWPAKNHATVGVQRGVQLFISRAPGAGDDFSHITTKAAWVAKYPGLETTFSNCSPNQAGIDKAPCTGEFKIPADLAEGVYTFMWWWEFNGGEFYNSCADVMVTNTPTNGGGTGGGGNGGGGNGGGTTPTTPPPTPPPEACTNNNLYAQCGGNNYNGPTCCPQGSFCNRYNEWYSQCIPGQSQNSLGSGDLTNAGNTAGGMSVGSYLGVGVAAVAGCVALVAGFTLYKKRQQQPGSYPSNAVQAYPQGYAQQQRVEGMI